MSSNKNGIHDACQIDAFQGGVGLRVVAGILLATYIIQNYLVRTTEVDSFVIAMPVWGLLSIIVLLHVHNKYVFLAVLAWAILISVYVAASFADNANGFVQLPFFVANGVFFAVVVLSSVRSPRSRSKWIEWGEVVLDVLLFAAIVYWINIIRVEQQYSPDAAYDIRANNYLIVADLLIIYALLRMNKNRLLSSILWGGVAVVGLVLLGSRAAMVFGTVAVLLRLYVVLPRRILIRTGVSALAAMISWAIIDMAFEESTLARLFSIVSFQDDQSFNQRSEIFRAWISNTSLYPECLIIPCLPRQGMYVHNFISLIEYFGIIGALLFLLSIGVIVRALVKGWRIPAFALFALCVMQIVLARSFGALVYPIFFAYAFLAIIWLRQRRPEERSVRNTGSVEL